MPDKPTTPFDERRIAAWIGRALRIEGRIISRENLTIDGEVEGSIELGAHSLAIGTGAVVTADLAARAITISGTVIGNVVATEKIDLQTTGSVDGNIEAPRLFVADGAMIRGKVEIQGNKRNPAAD